MIATTVIAERPTPVSSRAVARLVTFQANAFSSEQTEYQVVVTIRARLRPTRSDSQPAVVAPMNMPTNEAEVMRPIVVIERCHASRTAGAANPKLLRSPSSKKKM